MSYTKPEAVKLASAVKAIQGGASKNSVYTDDISGQPPLESATAYEADEWRGAKGFSPQGLNVRKH